MHPKCDRIFISLLMIMPPHMNRQNILNDLIQNLIGDLQQICEELKRKRKLENYKSTPKSRDILVFIVTRRT